MDSSAVIAILFREPDSMVLADFLFGSPCMMGAPTLAESGLVMTGRFGPRGITFLNALLAEAKVEIVAFEQADAQAAMDAFCTFGRGTGHRANLNYGDCMAYAVAKRLNAPLLFKGDDFIHTDIRAALPQGA